jgi:hypothetical protein
VDLYNIADSFLEILSRKRMANNVDENPNSKLLENISINERDNEIKSFRELSKLKSEKETEKKTQFREVLKKIEEIKKKREEKREESKKARKERRRKKKEEKTQFREVLKKKEEIKNIKEEKEEIKNIKEEKEKDSTKVNFNKSLASQVKVHPAVIRIVGKKIRKIERKRFLINRRVQEQKAAENRFKELEIKEKLKLERNFFFKELKQRWKEEQVKFLNRSGRIQNKSINLYKKKFKNKRLLKFEKNSVFQRLKDKKKILEEMWKEKQED